MWNRRNMLECKNPSLLNGGLEGRSLHLPQPVLFLGDGRGLLCTAPDP